MKKVLNNLSLKKKTKIIKKVIKNNKIKMKEVKFHNIKISLNKNIKKLCSFTLV